MAQNWAIVIGINQYRFLQPLKYAQRDAEAISDFLRQAAGFDRIFLFTDNSPAVNGKSTEPFRTNLLRVLRQVFEQPFMKDGDNFWFFFSGHGIRYREQDYLMPLDGDPEDVENTGISTHLIANYLRSCGADNTVMILDACRSEGKKSGEGIGRQTEADARQTGVISIFSCSPEQYSYEIEAIGQGAFTFALLEGLGIRGRCATVERLNQYLSSRVPELVNQHLGRARQIPYTIAEPIDRTHLILMPQYASLADIATLKNDAYRAQMRQNWDMAQRLWIRVLAAASGQDMEAIEALQQIAIGRSSGTIPEQAHSVISSTQPSTKSSNDQTNVPTSDQQSSDASLVDQIGPFTDGIAELQALTGVDLSRPQLITSRQAGMAAAYALRMKRAAENAKIFRDAAAEVLAYGTSSTDPLLPVKTASSPSLNLHLQTFGFETITINAAGKVIDRHLGQAEFFVEDLGNGITLEMVKIPGGSFKMGFQTPGDTRYKKELPQHNVTVPSFFIGKFSVTQAQWAEVSSLLQIAVFLEAAPSKFKGEFYPVEQVSWDEAVEFCGRLSRKTGRQYRLPSEAEWEYACRANTNTLFHFGESITPEFVNFACKGTTSVGSFGVANNFGLYDIHGNVWEWCIDHWHNTYERAPTDGSAWLGRKNQFRVARGGAWSEHADGCRSTFRRKIAQTSRYPYLGFRVVFS